MVLAVGRVRFKPTAMPVRVKESELLDYDVTRLSDRQRGISGEATMMAGDRELFLGRIHTGSTREGNRLSIGLLTHTYFTTLRPLLKWAEDHYLALFGLEAMDKVASPHNPSHTFTLEYDYTTIHKAIERNGTDWIQRAAELTSPPNRYTSLLICPHCLMPTKRKDPFCLSCRKQIPPAVYCGRCRRWRDLPADVCPKCKTPFQVEPGLPELAKTILAKGQDLVEIPNLATVEGIKSRPGWRKFTLGEFTIDVRLPAGEKKLDGFQAADYKRRGVPIRYAKVCQVESGGVPVGGILVSYGSLLVTQPLGSNLGAASEHLQEAIRLLLTDIVNWRDVPDAAKQLESQYMRNVVLQDVGSTG